MLRRLRLRRPAGSSPPGHARQVGRDAASMAMGSVSAQLIIVAVAPLLTRLYTPADLGAASVLVGVMLAAGAIACLRFDIAIPLADRENTAAVCVLSLVTALAVTAVLGVAALAFGPALCEWANVPEMADWTWLVPVHAAIAGLGMTATGLLVRRRRYGALASLRLSQATAQSATQIAAGAAGAGGPGFAAGTTVGMAAYAALGAIAGRTGTDVVRRGLGGIGAAARRWRTFAAWSTVATIFHIGSLVLPPILVAALYGPADAGLVVLAQRVLMLPVTVTGEAVASAWYGTAAEIVREGGAGLRAPLGTITRSLVLGGGALLAVVLIAGPPLFGPIFGDEWEGGGTVLLALAPLYFAVFAAIPAGQALQALGRTDLLTAGAVARVVAGVAGITGGHALGWSLAPALGLYAAGMAVVSIAIAVVAWRLSSP